MAGFQTLQEIVHPVELTAFVRELIDADYNGPTSLARFAPAVDRVLTEWSFDRAQRDRPEVARYRAFDVESPIIGRPGFSRVTGAIPPISVKTVLGEGDRTALDVAMRSGDRRSKMLKDLVFNDVERLTKSVLGRIEQARGKMFLTGTITFNPAEGIPSTVNYNDSESTINTATAATLWSVAGSATPVQNERAWMAAYRLANNEDMPVVGLTSRRVIDAYMATTEVKNMFAANGVVPGLVSDAQFTQLRSTFGLVPLVEYKTRVRADGTVSRVIPDNVIVYMPAPSVDDFAETTFGVSMDSLRMVETGQLPMEPTGGRNGAPGLVASAWETNDPVQRWTKVGGLVFPVLKDPKRIFVATVLS